MKRLTEVTHRGCEHRVGGRFLRAMIRDPRVIRCEGENAISTLVAIVTLIAGLLAWLGQSLAHAQAIIEAWRREYNDERPKKGLGGLTPVSTTGSWRRLGRSASEEQLVLTGLELGVVERHDCRLEADRAQQSHPVVTRE